MCLRKARLGRGLEQSGKWWNETRQDEGGGGAFCTQIGSVNFVVNAVKKPLEVFYKGGHDLIYVFKRPSAAVWGLNGRRETN